MALGSSAPSRNLSISLQMESAAQHLLLFVMISSFPAEKIIDKKYALGPVRLDSSPEAVILASLPNSRCHLLQETLCHSLICV